MFRIIVVLDKTDKINLPLVHRSDYLHLVDDKSAIRSIS